MVRSAEGGRIAVELEAPPRCAGCSGACLWYRRSASGPLSLKVSDRALPVGATVTLTAPEGQLLLGALLLYGLPLVAMLLGASVAAAASSSDLAAAAGAVGALAVALLAVAALRRRLERSLLERLVVRVVD